jgi:putative hydrolase of the HAD superfamily
MPLSSDTLICVDFDDTLVANQEHFEHAVRQLAALLHRTVGTPPEAVEPAFAAVDARHHHLGRHRNRFLMTIFATYCHVAGVEAVPAELLQPLAEISAYPYDAPPTPQPGVRAALTRLRAAHPGPLWLVTTGDLVVQTGRVYRSGLAGCFDRVHVLPQKTPAAFAEIARGHPRRLMIGNSPATDILPAMAAGYRVAYVRTPTWALDMVPLPPGVPEYPSFAAAVEALLASGVGAAD